MKLYNTLSRVVEDFKPLSRESVSLYSCGPTVYDYAQIGNLRKFVFDDTLRRVLQSNGFIVRHVMNITDVGHLVSDADEGEDKLEKGAAREGKTVWQVADHYTEAFKHDVQALNILLPNAYQGKKDSYPRATDFIDEQIQLIKILLDKKFAYKTEGAIYFDVSKLSSYGELTAQKLIDKEVGARSEVVTDPNKRNPYDFALWFFTVGHFAQHSMHWPSPWGDGFPGWHLECSAIIHSILGDPIDIHTGGVDNIGTHHVNEMAQTEAAFGHKLARYWLHSEHLLVDGKKMSKSLGNFYTLKDVTDKGFDPMALRLLYLQAHYRSQMNFTWEGLEAIAHSLMNFYSWADLQFQSLSSEKLMTNYEEALSSFKDALSDDLDTPSALAIFNGMVNRVEELGADSEAVAKAIPTLEAALGLGLNTRQDISQSQKQLLYQREKVRSEESWNKADEMRLQLSQQGIEIKDTPQGPIWSRVD